MKTCRIKLLPKGPWITPFQADTLFGHMCWIIPYRDGVPALKEFLKPFKDGMPTFLLSDGFICDELPFPMIDPYIAEALQVEREIEAWDDKKDFLKEKFLVSLEDFRNLVDAEEPADALNEVFRAFRERRRGSAGQGLSHKVEATLRNRIDRRTFTTPDVGGLYPLEEHFLAPGCYISIYVKCETGELPGITDLLRIIGEQGYGKKRTIGRGVYEIKDEPEEVDLPYSGGRFVTLSPFIPANGQVDVYKSRYQLRLKTGRLGEQFSKAGMPFAKKPLVFFEPGSVFQPIDDHSFYGRMIEDIVPHAEGELKDVVQYAYAFPVGVKSL